MSPLIWTFLAGWAARSVFFKPKKREPVIEALANGLLVTVIAFCLWRALR